MAKKATNMFVSFASTATGANDALRAMGVDPRRVRRGSRTDDLEATASTDDEPADTYLDVPELQAVPAT